MRNDPVTKAALFAAGGTTLASLGFGAFHERSAHEPEFVANHEARSSSVTPHGEPIARSRTSPGALGLTMAGVAGIERLYGDRSELAQELIATTTLQGKIGATLARLKRAYNEGIERGDRTGVIEETQRLEQLVLNLDRTVLEMPLDPSGDRAKTVGSALQAVAASSPSLPNWHDLIISCERIEARVLPHGSPDMGLCIDGTLSHLRDQLGMLTRPDYLPSDSETTPSNMSTYAAVRLGNSVPGISTVRWLLLPHATVAQELQGLVRQLGADRELLVRWSNDSGQFASMWGELSPIGREYVSVQSLALADGTKAPTRVTVVSPDERYLLEAGKEYARTREGLFRAYRELMNPADGGFADNEFDVQHVIERASKLRDDFVRSLPKTSTRYLEQFSIAITAQDREACLSGANTLMTETFPEGPMVRAEIESARETLAAVITALERDTARGAPTALGLASTITWARQCLDPAALNSFSVVKSGTVERNLVLARDATMRSFIRP